MKFTLAWLKDHLDTNASLDEISRMLTAIGLEVEQIVDRAQALKAFTVAKILAAEKHPEADKLQICRVESDAGELQIVCGAPNARAGLYAALAKEGAHIPGNGMVIKKTKIRGVESNGMLCSAEELGLPGDSSGILELPEAPIGASVAELLGLNDPVIEIAITPNRADCLGVHGIARDLAAAGLGSLKDSEFRIQDSGAFASPISVRIETYSCRQFIGAYLRGVTNGESPAWMKARLEAIGQRPISALVDITNYFTFDLGRPLHVYDARKLRGNLVVRDAKPGESLKALNGKAYALRPGMSVIADAEAPLALAGIIGGEASSVDAQTTEIFLEVALFDPLLVAQTGRALGIDSDARYRFERGVDPALGEPGARMAIAMICELCGGKASELVIAGGTPAWQRSITFTPARVQNLGGVAIAADKLRPILQSLGFAVAGQGEQWQVSPPSWRGDVEGEADLVEEALRIHGYDAIPSLPLPASPEKIAPNPAQDRAAQAKHLLASRGMLECCSWSFLPAAQAALFGGASPALTLLNPISSELDTMRPSLLPNLLAAAQRNGSRGLKNCALFEVGLQFHDVTPQGQRVVAAGIRSGQTIERSYKDGLFQRGERPVDAFDAKAELQALLESFGVSKQDITTNTPSWYHPGRSGALTLGGKIILGHFGEMHPSILKAYGLESAVAFELFLDAVPVSRAKSKARAALKLSDYQAVERDFAFTVEAGVTAQNIVKTLAKAEKQLITGIEIFDVYSGKGVEPGKKSVAVKVTLQAMDRTLSDAEITAVSNAIIKAAESFGGQLRQ